MSKREFLKTYRDTKRRLEHSRDRNERRYYSWELNQIVKERVMNKRGR